ncbi:hypothetical protein VTO42DRAFT_2591 [Malbranchea cinnamomea]
MCFTQPCASLQCLSPSLSLFLSLLFFIFLVLFSLSPSFFSHLPSRNRAGRKVLAGQGQAMIQSREESNLIFCRTITLPVYGVRWPTLPTLPTLVGGLTLTSSRTVHAHSTRCLHVWLAYQDGHISYVALNISRL